MSFDALSWAWNQKTGSAGRKATLMGVAQFADEDGYCWPGQKMLAEFTEQSARTIREHLTWLEDNGYLSRKARKRPDGTHASDAYYLNLEKPAAQFETKRKKNPADYAAAETTKRQRQNPPPADFASGEKQHDPAAKSATHESVIDKPKGLSEPVSTARGSRLPNEWKLPKAWGEEAMAIDPTWTPEHVRFEADKFRDYWVAVSGKQGLKLDWPATWRNWVRNAGPMRAEKRGGGAWWMSPESRLSKARENGVGDPLPGESDASYQTRIQAAIDNGGKPPAPRALPVTPLDPVPVVDEKRTGPTDTSRAEVSAAMAILKKRHAVAPAMTH